MFNCVIFKIQAVIIRVALILLWSSMEIIMVNNYGFAAQDRLSNFTC